MHSVVVFPDNAIETMREEKNNKPLIHVRCIGGKGEKLKTADSRGDFAEEKYSSHRPVALSSSPPRQTKEYIEVMDFPV